VTRRDPRVESSRRRDVPHVSPALAGKSVLSPTLNPAAKEQYRKLAGVLHNGQATGGIKTLIITSAVAGEGKSLTAVNLALTLSQSFGRRVLLIDADLRRPSLHDAFQIPLSPGLAEALQPGVPSMAAPVAVASALGVLPAGRSSDPIRVLSAANLRTVLAAIGGPFDWVLIDTPPVGLLSDAKLVSDHADGVLLIVGAGRAPRGLIRNAVETLGREKVLGVVLNRADDLAVMGGYYYGYYDYGHYEGQPRTPRSAALP
jgi:protein-tyrosine kinase